MRWSAGVLREVLPNGLTLLAQQERSAPVVAVVTHVKAGFFDEPDRWVGISHVLEHMFFKGTARRGVGAIARETKAAGGYLNASTSYDHTSYFAVLPTRGLEAALDIQSDALRNSAIDADELGRELRVIIQEAKRKLDSPDAVAYETLHEIMFDRHRIRRWRIGREADLAGFTRADVWGYYHSRYVPERTIVSIVGDVAPDEALALARSRYGDWTPARGAEDRSPEEPVRREIRARTLRGDVAQAELAVGWRTVPPLHPDAAPLDLAAAILASGRGSWLQRALRETGVVISVSAHNYAPTELGVFGVTADLDADRVGPALEGIAKATSRLALLGPSEADFDRARTLLLTRWARRLESMEGRAAALAAAEALESVEVLDREYDALAGATAAHVRAVAERYLDPEAVSALVYLPHDRGEDLTTDQVGRTFAVTGLDVDGQRAASAPLPSPPQPARGRTEAGVLHVALAGADLLVRPKSGVPTVSLGLYVPRLEFEPPEQAGLGALVARSALRGAGGLDAGALAFAAERLGGSLSAVLNSDWLGFGLTVLSQRLPEAAALLDVVYRSPTLSNDDVAAERDALAAEAKQLADDMFRFPFQLAFGAAFSDLGYGLPVAGLPETLPALTAMEARRWHEAAFLDLRPVIVAVGDLDARSAADQLAGVFACLPSRPAAAVPGDHVWALGSRTVERVVQRDKAQSAVAMVFRGPARRGPDRRAAEVWAAVASGLGGRIFEALRERRSLAYSVMASSWQKGRAGALVTYIATSPEREEEARAAMLAELQGFASQPVSSEELTQAINYLAGQAEVRRQHATAVAGDVLEAWLVGCGLEELKEPGADYRKVTAAQVQQVAETCLGTLTRAEGIVRGSGRGR
jgi:zinc protease